MDQNSTPGGRPAPKKPCFGNRVFDDPNIEQTLLMDTMNVGGTPATNSTSGDAKFAAPMSLFGAESGGGRAEFDDSLAELTCSFNPPSANPPPVPETVQEAFEAAITFQTVQNVSFSKHPTPAPPVVEKESMSVNSGDCSLNNVEESEKRTEMLIEEISVMEIEKTVEMPHETTIALLPDVDIQAAIHEELELELGPTTPEQMAELSEKMALMEFLWAEHVTAIVNKDYAKTKKTDIVDSLRGCVRSVVVLGRNAAKAKFDETQQKDRADFESMLAVEREKTKNAFQENQLLRSRIAELEEAKKKVDQTCKELINQNKRLEKLAEEADLLETQVIKMRVEKKKLVAKLEVAEKK